MAVLMASTSFAQARRNTGCLDLNAAKNGAKASWSQIGTPFTTYDFRDVNQTNPISLQAWLDSGFCVVVDFSCTWCTPCWNVHQAGILEGYYNQFGPNGTNQLRVLWVEVEESNTTAQITGPAGGSTYADATTGDWTLGGTVPYPMADDADALTTCASLYDNAVPYIVFIAPNGYYRSIYGEEDAIYSYDVQENNTKLANIIANYPRSGQAPVINSYKIPASANKGATVNFNVDVMSVDDYSINWTFENGTPSSANTASASCTWNTPGTYNVTVVVTNSTGSATQSGTITISDYDYYWDFENSADYSSWTLIDADGDGQNWTFDYLRGQSGGYDESQGILASASWTQATGALTPDNWVFTTAVTVPNADNAKLSWYEKGQDPSYAEEHYAVYVATSPNANSATIVWEGNATGEWLQHVISLAPYKGQTVYIGLRHFNVTDMFFLDIDNIAVYAGAGAVSINNAEQVSTNLYPNPTTGMVTIEAESFQNATVIDMTGRVVMTSNNNVIDMSNLNNGVYMVRINTANGTATQKIVKK